MHRLERGVLLEKLSFPRVNKNIEKSTSMSTTHEACILALLVNFFNFLFQVSFVAIHLLLYSEYPAHDFKKCLHSAMHAGVYFR